MLEIQYHLQASHLSGEVRSTTLRCLEYDGGFGITGGFEGSNDG